MVVIDLVVVLVTGHLIFLSAFAVILGFTPQVKACFLWQFGLLGISYLYLWLYSCDTWRQLSSVIHPLEDFVLFNGVDVHLNHSSVEV